MKKYLFVFAAALTLLCAPLRAQEPSVIEVGLLSTTHMIFKTDVVYVDIPVIGLLKSDVVKSSKNILAFKAAKEFTEEISLTVLESNGSMHVFYVHYAAKPSRLIVDVREPVSEVAPVQPKAAAKGKGKVKQPVAPADTVVSSSAGAPVTVNVASENSSNFGRADAPTLKEVVGMERRLFHIGSRNFGVEVYVSNIFAYSDLTYIVLTIVNNTDIGYEASKPELMVESLRKGKQALDTRKEVLTKSLYGSLSCRPHSSSTVGITIAKQTLLPKECLRVYVYERSGNRTNTITLHDKDVNFAVSPIL